MMMVAVDMVPLSLHYVTFVTLFCPQYSVN